MRDGLLPSFQAQIEVYPGRGRPWAIADPMKLRADGGQRTRVSQPHRLHTLQVQDEAERAMSLSYSRSQTELQDTIQPSVNKIPGRPEKGLEVEM